MYARLLSIVLCWLLCLTGPRPASAMTIAEVVAKARTSIVRVEVSGVGLVPDPDDKSRLIEQHKAGAGTGFVIDGDGWIVTNSHVVRPPGIKWKGEPQIRVDFPAGHLDYGVELVAHDPLSDLAVLKIKSKELGYAATVYARAKGEKDLFRALAWADPERVVVGEEVLAIGFARDLQGAPSVTRGIVSATRRQYRRVGPDGRPTIVSGLVQTDAAINPGNSGGPLLNLRGEVIGVNTYRYPFSATVDEATGRLQELDPTEGIHFARSAETARPIVERLKQGPIHRFDLGVRLQSVTREISDNQALMPGVAIVGFEEDSVLKAAGAEPYDVIVNVLAGLSRWDAIAQAKNFERPREGRAWSIECDGDLQNALAQIAPGEVLTIAIARPSRKVLERISKNQLAPAGVHRTDCELVFLKIVAR